MDLSKLQFSGDFSAQPNILEKFSKDASSYQIYPALVAEPKTEADVAALIQFAREEGLSIVARGGGSGLSGAGIGTGIIVNFKKYFNRVLQVGEETIVQPGAVLDAFLNQLNTHRLMLPSVPSSSALCTLGGNVGTRSTGPCTARYGTIDDFIDSLRLVTARGEVVDTRDPLPTDLAEELRKIQQQFKNDPVSQQIVQQRPFIAGGYNLNAFMKFSQPNQLAAHLMVGSVGTLVGEHNAGRSRSVYLEQELGPAYTYLKQIKQLFDSGDRLNPGSVFNTAPIHENMNLS